MHDLGLTPQQKAKLKAKILNPATTEAELAEIEMLLGVPLAPSIVDNFPDPAAYFRDALRVQHTPQQLEIARLLTVPPYRVLVKASNDVGKSFLAGSLVNWWYDRYPRGLCITTAPNADQVTDIIWKEVRSQRKHNTKAFRGPKIPELFASETHRAYGYTAKDATGFQGRHECKGCVLAIFDEAVGIKPEFWVAARTMADAWLAIFNPTDPSSQAMAEERTGKWHVVTMSATDHPNVIAELEGRTKPFPFASLDLAKVTDRIENWCTRVTEASASNIEWPPGSGKWWKPGPEAESRVLGRWPSQAMYGVYSDALWKSLMVPRGYNKEDIIEFGVDVATHGDDWCSIHKRRGCTSLAHESYNGLGPVEIENRIMYLVKEAADELRADGWEYADWHQIPVKIDDDGAGGVIVAHLREKGCRAIPVNASSTPLRPDKYRNKRSELWFYCAELADKGRMSFERMPKDVQQRMMQQAMAPEFNLDTAGRRVVDKKEKTKEKIGRSPDDIDSAHLAYYDTCFDPYGVPPETINEVPTPVYANVELDDDDYISAAFGAPEASRRGLFGIGRQR